MEAVAVVKHLDVIHRIGPGFIPRGVERIVCSLGFQAAEKTFGHCIIPAVPLAAHRADHLVIFQFLLIGLGSVLAALIRMVKETRSKMTAKYSQPCMVHKYVISAHHTLSG